MIYPNKEDIARLNAEMAKLKEENIGFSRKYWTQGQYRSAIEREKK